MYHIVYRRFILPAAHSAMSGSSPANPADLVPSTHHKLFPSKFPDQPLKSPVRIGRCKHRFVIHISAAVPQFKQCLIQSFIPESAHNDNTLSK